MARRVVVPEDTKKLKLRLVLPSILLILLCASAAVIPHNARKGRANASSLELCSNCSNHSPVSAAAGDRSARACTVSASTPGTITPTDAQSGSTYKVTEAPGDCVMGAKMEKKGCKWAVVGCDTVVSAKGL
jgi:hypothetical protein